MSATNLIDIQELSPVELCNHIQHNYYLTIKELLKAIHHCTDSMINDADDTVQAELLTLLLLRLEDETLQMMRNDELVIFPLIKSDFSDQKCSTRKLPTGMIQQMHLKIMTLLEKIRQFLNNYLVKPGWSDDFTKTCSNMFNLEQQMHQAIYIKENQLLPKVKERFNQSCNGDCKKNLLSHPGKNKLPETAV